MSNAMDETDMWNGTEEDGM